MNKRNALFFLRHYNDIDHIVPVIYKWSKAGHRCTVVLIGFNAVNTDYRIRFISTLSRVRVLDIRDVLGGVDLFRFRLFSLVLYGRSVRYFNRSIDQLCDIFWPAGQRRRLWDQVAQLLLNRAFHGDTDSIKGAVVFDWISPKSTLPLEFVDRVVALSRQHGHTCISLPHGDSPHVSELIRNRELRIEPQEKYACSDIFDYIVCPNELCAKRYRPFIDDRKIKVLGSPRFNDEWLNVLQGLLPAPATRKNRHTLCIVFFLRKNEFSLFWDEIQRVINMLIQFEHVTLIIKPHTRDYLQQPLKNVLNGIQSPRLTVARDDEHSVNLLAKADMVIDVATSIAFEAVKRGIPVLSADYLHAGYSAIAHYIPETAMRCRDDIYHAISQITRNPHQPFYNEQHRETFIRQMLDVPDRQVLERYIDLLAEEKTQVVKQLAA